MASQDVRFVIAVDDAGFIRKMTEAERALYDLQKTTKTADSAFSQLWKGFAVGNLAVSALHKGFALLKGFVSSSISEALEAERAQHSLGVALEMAGRFGAYARDSFIAFSQEQQNLTLYTDEQIQATMTLLAQMTKLDTEGLKKATKGVMGLATVMDVDLESAARRVMVAMAGNTEGLSRYGIHVDSTLPKQAQMVQALEQMVALYPRATAEMGTMGGQISMMNKNWGELKEGVGGMILEALNAKENIAILNDVLKAMKKTTEESKKPLDDFNLRMGVMRGYVTGFAADEQVAAARTKELDEKIRGAADAFFKDFYPTVTASTEVLHKLTVEALDAKKAFDDLKAANVDMLTAFDQELPPIEDVFPAPKEFENPLQDYIDAAISGLPKATSAFKKHFKNIGEYSDKFYQDLTRGFTNAFMQLAFTVEGFKNFFIGMWQAIKQAFFQILADMLARWIAMAFVRFLVNTFLLPSAGIVPGIVGGILPMQHGFQGVISRPTPILVGEAGPEYVSVTPMSRGGARGGGGATNINVSIYAYDNSDMERAVRQQVVPILKEVYAHGGL